MGQVAKQVFSWASARLLHEVSVKHNFSAQLTSFKRYFLMECADWLNIFLESGAEKELDKPNPPIERLNNLLAYSLSSSST